MITAIGLMLMCVGVLLLMVAVGYSRYQSDKKDDRRVLGFQERVEARLDTYEKNPALLWELEQAGKRESKRLAKPNYEKNHGIYTPPVERRLVERPPVERPPVERRLVHNAYKREVLNWYKQDRTLDYQKVLERMRNLL